MESQKEDDDWPGLQRLKSQLMEMSRQEQNKPTHIQIINRSERNLWPRTLRVTAMILILGQLLVLGTHASARPSPEETVHDQIYGWGAARASPDLSLGEERTAGTSQAPGPLRLVPGGLDATAVNKGRGRGTAALPRFPFDVADAVVDAANTRSYAPATGQVIVDPDNPSWFRYKGGGPFFMCGPGDPEGFLYRGTRSADGTRSGDQMSLIEKVSGTGANSIYLMAVRSHGGDGDPTQNPFVDSDPSKGLDQDILAQWDLWFDEMDQNGIMIFFFFYDDSSRIWNTGDAVGADERAFIQGLVNAFEDKQHLIWVVAEEYSERYSSTRVSNIAAEIRAADDNDHPISVHKRNGLNFGEFENDTNIDQFAVQYTSDDAAGFHDAMVRAWEAANGRYNLNMAEGHPDAFGAEARRRSWAAAMGGAYIMHLRWDIANTPAEDLEDCGRLVSFMEATDFPDMSPRDDLAYGATDYVLADPGASYMAYSSNRSGNMGLRNLTPGMYEFTWLDIPSGATVRQTDIAVDSGDQTWLTPASIGSELAVSIRRTGPLDSLVGDLNLDGVVDVLDVQLCVNVVLGTETDPGIVSRSDVNGDNTVDVLDVQIIVNTVLGVG